MKKLRVALVGLGFGGAFAKIYKDHPNVDSLVIYDPNPETAKKHMQLYRRCRNSIVL